jgi:hypothetical protein
MRKKKELQSKEIKEIKMLKNIVTDEDTFMDFNPLDVLPEVIDKDYGFFLMFGHQDNPIPGQASEFVDFPKRVQTY